MPRSLLLVALLAFAIPVSPAPAEPQATHAKTVPTAGVGASRWRPDLALLRRELPLRHPARDQPANRFRTFERDVNTLGYNLANSGRMALAIQAFRINTRVYAHSANTFDSLAETLLNAGDRDAAIATYRQALVVEPGFPPSTQALQRLGVR